MLLLTHNDLDAVGCELVLRKYANIDRIFYEDYITLSQTVTDIIQFRKHSKIDVLIIADISFSDNKALLQKLVNVFKYVIHLDHHSYPEGFSITVPEGKTFRQVIDTNRCACKICFDVFKGTDSYLNNLVNLIDKFDRWVEDSEDFQKAVDLNDYFWKIGYYNFYTQFKESYPQDYQQQIEVIHSETENGLKELCEKNFIARDRKVTIQIGSDFGFNGQIIEFKEMQKGYIFILKTILRIRLNQKVFDPKTAETCRFRITNSVTGHPYAFNVNLKNVNNVLEEVKRISGIINSF